MACEWWTKSFGKTAEKQGRIQEFALGGPSPFPLSPSFPSLLFLLPLPSFPPPYFPLPPVLSFPSQPIPFPSLPYITSN